MKTYAGQILLVEDNPNDLELALHAFETHPLANAIEVARDGQEALDYLFGGNGSSAKPPPKLVLLDLKLPKVDGLEVLRRIRSDPKLKHLPVTILTSSREEIDLVRGYDLGVNSYIVKPVDFDRFVETVQTLGMYWLLLNEPPANVRPES
jgi:two-component system response regulator